MSGYINALLKTQPKISNKLIENSRGPPHLKLEIVNNSRQFNVNKIKKNIKILILHMDFLFEFVNHFLIRYFNFCLSNTLIDHLMHQKFDLFYQSIVLKQTVKNLIQIWEDYNYHQIRMQILEWVKRQTGKLADNVKDYKFYVKNQPNFVDSSTTIILTPFTNRDQIATVPCVYRWSRIKNGLLSQVPEFKGNSFICEPSDIGCIIQAEVTSTDSAHPGTAILKYGPVKLDVLVKKQVEHALTSGSVVMNIDLVQKDEVKQCQVRVTEQNIKITHFNSNNSTSFDYTLGQPRIQASIKQPNKVQIYFNEKYENEIVRFTNSLFGFQDLSTSKQSNEKKLQLKFANRNLKDNFLLIIKSFNTKKAMKTSAILNKLENVDLTGNQNFNYILEIQSLRIDLIKLARLNDKYQADKRIYYDQARKLEKEIEDIIVTYTKITQGKCKSQNQLDQSVSYMRDKRDEVMDRKLQTLARENDTLRDRIQFMNQQLASRGVAHLVSEIPMRSNSGVQQHSTNSRGGFIKKRTVPEVAVNPFAILDDLEKSQIREPVDPEKQMLAKHLNQSVRKIAKLEEKIQQLKNNRTAINLDVSNISGISEIKQESPTKKLNMTSMEADRKGRQQFCAQIDQLRRKNKKLQQQNIKLKESSILVSRVEDRQEELNKSQISVNKSQVLKNSSALLNPQFKTISGPSSESELRKIIQDLTNQNQKLKEQIQRLRIQKQIIQKQKSQLHTKYKKRMSQLSNENSMYKRSQDALNRSQNLSMQMQAFNQQQTNNLKQEIDLLMNENLKITNLHKKAMEELKQMNKLKQENMKLMETINQLTHSAN